MGTVLSHEAEHFGALAADWWNPKGSSAMLHKLNPVRLGFIREQIDTHFGSSPTGFHPLAGKSALDVGCGAGLLCEPLARLGASITGIDAAPENIAAAKVHAGQSGLGIQYRAGDFLDMELPLFDLVTSLEVIEHVADPSLFLQGLANRMKADGLMILSTPNRTPASKLLLVEAAERLGQVPRGTHHWDQFITPDEFIEMAVSAGLAISEMKGISFSPARGLTINDDLSLNYIMAIKRL